METESVVLSFFNKTKYIEKTFTRYTVFKSNAYPIGTNSFSFDIPKGFMNASKVWICFRYTDALNNISKNTNIFQHMNLRTFYIEYGGIKFPQEPIKCDFEHNDYSIAYENFLDSGYGNHQEHSDFITRQMYKDVYPIFYEDISARDESVFAENNARISIYIELAQDAPKAFETICFIEHEGKYRYNPKAPKNEVFKVIN